MSVIIFILIIIFQLWIINKQRRVIYKQNNIIITYDELNKSKSSKSSKSYLKLNKYKSKNKTKKLESLEMDVLQNHDSDDIIEQYRHNLTEDPFDLLRSEETNIDKIKRNLINSGQEGPMMEGMGTPFSDIGDKYCKLLLSKKK
jgi:hypothetical protein